MGDIPQLANLCDLEDLRSLVERYSNAPPGCEPLQPTDQDDLRQTLWECVLEHVAQNLSPNDWKRLLNRTRQRWWRQQHRWTKMHNTYSTLPESLIPVQPGDSTPPGLILGEPDSVYHAQTEYLTSHLLADFRRSPLLYYKKKNGLVKEEDRPAFLVGRALHTLVLEGIRVFEHHYIVGGPINPKTGEVYGPNTKAFTDWAAAQGKPVLAVQQYDLIQRMAEGVYTHSLAADILSTGVPEAVVRIEYRGIPCQIRMDWLSPRHGIVELKTCDDIDWFEADARRYGYVYQVAFYQAILCERFQPSSDITVPVYLIAIEKREPYRCGVWRVHDHILAQARRENEEAIERLKHCIETNHWPTGYEELRVFDTL